MKVEAENNSIDSNKTLARAEAETVTLLFTSTWEQHAHSHRWLMASLLAINGGACLAVFGQKLLPIKFILTSGGLFLIGVLMALLVAVSGQYATNKILKPLKEYREYLISVQHDGIRDENYESTQTSEIIEKSKSGFWSQAFGWASATAFLAGAITVGIGLNVTASTATADSEIKETPPVPSSEANSEGPSTTKSSNASLKN